jgi:hypothetical protein
MRELVSPLKTQKSLIQSPSPSSVAWNPAGDLVSLKTFYREPKAEQIEHIGLTHENQRIENGVLIRNCLRQSRKALARTKLSLT